MLIDQEIEEMRRHMWRRYGTTPERRQVEAERRQEAAARRLAEHTKLQQRAARRRALRAHSRIGVQGSITAAELLALRTVADGICSYCLQPSHRMHVEHCIPISRGGQNTADNVVMACPTCNLRKGASTPLEHLLGWYRTTPKY